MNKALPKYHNGVEYVRLSQLPFAQATSLQEWLPVIKMVKVSDDPSEDCIPYEAYERWYDNFFCAAEKFIEFDI